MPKAVRNGGKFKLFLFGGFCFVCLGLSTVNFVYLGKSETKVLGASYDSSEEITYWEGIVTQNPTFQDGWLELARLEYENGNLEKFNLFLQKAKDIDPNSSKILMLEQALLSGR